MWPRASCEMGSVLNGAKLRPFWDGFEVGFFTGSGSGFEKGFSQARDLNRSFNGSITAIDSGIESILPRVSEQLGQKGETVTIDT